MQSRRSWLAISGQRLRDNYRALVNAASSEGRDISLLAVIKAGAYGHGAALCAGVLGAAGATWLGVADAEEGSVVRRFLDDILGCQVANPRVLVMGGLLRSEAQAIIANQLTPVMWTPHHLAAFDGITSMANPQGLHLEIDTGMSRQGVAPGATLESFLDDLQDRPQLSLEGVLTHFASAEVVGDPITQLQRKRFETALEQIAARGLRPFWIHAGNTSTIDEESSLPWLKELATRNGGRPMVRSGLALYGYAMALEGGQSSLQQEIRPVLAWKTRILSLSEVPAGTMIGYNATFITERSMRLALIPVGYADGLRRELSATNTRAGGWVQIRGRPAPIVGLISMNLTTVDVSAIPEAALEDEVTVLGEGITAEDHAELAHTVCYEILCGLRSQPELSD